MFPARAGWLPVRAGLYRPQCTEGDTDCSESLTLLAVGYDDGGVVIHRGDITRDRGHKTKVLLERGHTLAGMAFKTTETGTFLYIATSEDVLLYNVTHNITRDNRLFIFCCWT